MKNERVANRHAKSEMAYSAVGRVKKMNKNPLAHGHMEGHDRGDGQVMRDSMDRGPKSDPYK